MDTALKKTGRRGNFYVERSGAQEKDKKQKKTPRKLTLPKLPVNGRRIRNAGLVLVAIVLLVLLAFGIGRLFVWGYNAAVTSSMFLTKTIEVTGNVRLPRDLVLTYAGISEGQNSLAVNIASVEQNLRKTPWVEQVSVKRLLPDKFVIRIRERMPSFWVHKEGVLYYADVMGQVIAPVESTNFLSLPALTVEPGADELRPCLARFLESVRTGDLPLDMAAISQITLSLSRGLELFLEDRELWLSFDPVNWDQNVLRIKRVFADLIKRREMKNVREMRVIDGNVWVVLNKSVKSTGAE